MEQGVCDEVEIVVPCFEAWRNSAADRAVWVVRGGFSRIDATSPRRSLPEVHQTPLQK
jgi:hypothetical protein